MRDALLNTGWKLMRDPCYQGLFAGESTGGGLYSAGFNTSGIGLGVGFASIGAGAFGAHSAPPSSGADLLGATGAWSAGAPNTNGAPLAAPSCTSADEGGDCRGLVGVNDFRPGTWLTDNLDFWRTCDSRSWAKVLRCFLHNLSVKYWDASVTGAKRS